MKTTITCFLIAFGVLLTSANLSAAPKKKGQEVYTDPANAGPDYAIQGEYAADKMGAQVIALGDNKFQAVIYTGGLPGAGWKRKMKKESVTLERKDKAISQTGKSPFESASIKDGALIVTKKNGSILKFKKTVRKSPTLGAKAPKGAKVLFDGTSAEHFKNGKMTKDKLLMMGTSSIMSAGDCKIHIEFRTPFKPKARGQGRGNSGVYFQSRYECQVLDSFGLEGKNNECGGLYSVKEPIVNMCFPPLTWQTYDVDFTAPRFKDGKKVSNAKVTIKHNGVLIHKDVEVPRGTPAGRKEAESAEPLIYLQNHGNPVFFRNIWVLEK